MLWCGPSEHDRTDRSRNHRASTTRSFELRVMERRRAARALRCEVRVAIVPAYFSEKGCNKPKSGNGVTSTSSYRPSGLVDDTRDFALSSSTRECQRGEPGNPKKSFCSPHHLNSPCGTVAPKRLAQPWQTWKVVFFRICTRSRG